MHWAAISLPGTLAAAAGPLVIGAALVGLLALESFLVGARYIVPLSFLVSVALVGGLIGSLFDNLLERLSRLSIAHGEPD